MVGEQAYLPTRTDFRHHGGFHADKTDRPNKSGVRARLRSKIYTFTFWSELRMEHVICTSVLVDSLEGRLKYKV